MYPDAAAKADGLFSLAVSSCQIAPDSFDVTQKVNDALLQCFSKTSDF
jgi:hypothetical protein